MVSHHSSHLAAYSFALTLTRGIRLEGDLRLATFLPIIYHVADQVFTFPAFLSGGTLIIGRRPDPVQIADAISREAVTALWGGVAGHGSARWPRFWRVTRSRYDPRSLKVLVYGWAALPPGVLATFKRLCGDDFTAVEIFGQTEAISCHRFWPDKWPDLYRRTAPEHNYVGIPNPLLDSTVMDETGAMLDGQPGVPGEAVYRSPAITAGYYRDLPATEHAFRHGWFHSGDSLRVRRRRPAHHGRPVQGHREVRRRERVQPAGRGRAAPAPGSAQGGGHRAAARPLGRGGHRHRHRRRRVPRRTARN